MGWRGLVTAGGRPSSHHGPPALSAAGPGRVCATGQRTLPSTICGHQVMASSADEEPAMSRGRVCNAGLSILRLGVWSTRMAHRLVGCFFGILDRCRCFSPGPIRARRAAGPKTARVAGLGGDWAGVPAAVADGANVQRAAHAGGLRDSKVARCWPRRRHFCNWLARELGGPRVQCRQPVGCNAALATTSPPREPSRRPSSHRAIEPSSQRASGPGAVARHCAPRATPERALPWPRLSRLASPRLACCWILTTLHPQGRQTTASSSCNPALFPFACFPVPYSTPAAIARPNCARAALSSVESTVTYPLWQRPFTARPHCRRPGRRRPQQGPSSDKQHSLRRRDSSLSESTAPTVAE